MVTVAPFRSIRKPKGGPDPSDGFWSPAEIAPESPSDGPLVSREISEAVAARHNATPFTSTSLSVLASHPSSSALSAAYTEEGENARSEADS